MNFEAALRQVQAARVATDLGCYLVAQCLTENAERMIHEQIALEVARRFVDQQMQPGGLLHAIVNGESQGGVVQAREYLVGSESPEVFVPLSEFQCPVCKRRKTNVLGLPHICYGEPQ